MTTDSAAAADDDKVVAAKAAASEAVTCMTDRVTRCQSILPTMKRSFDDNLGLIKG